VASCYGSSSDARRSPPRARGLPDQVAGDANFRPGSWVRPDAAAHRQTPGAPAAACGLGLGSGCQKRGAPPGAWLLANAAAHQRTQGLRRGRAGFRIKLPATQISAGLLGVASCYGSSSDARRSPPRARGLPDQVAGDANFRPGSWVRPDAAVRRSRVGSRATAVYTALIQKTG